MSAAYCAVYGERDDRAFGQTSTWLTDNAVVAIQAAALSSRPSGYSSSGS